MKNKLALIMCFATYSLCADNNTELENTVTIQIVRTSNADNQQDVQKIQVRVISPEEAEILKAEYETTEVEAFKDTQLASSTFAIDNVIYMIQSADQEEQIETIVVE